MENGYCIMLLNVSIRKFRLHLCKYCTHCYFDDVFILTVLTIQLFSSIYPLIKVQIM